MKKKRVLSLLLAASLTLGLLPAVSMPVSAADAGNYIEVYVGDGRIGNGDNAKSGTNGENDPTTGYEATNLAGNFIRNGNRNTIPGFKTEQGNVANTGNAQWHYTGDNQVRLWGWGTELYMTMTTADNPVLKALAQSSTAQFSINISTEQSDKDYHTSKAHYDIERIWVEVTVVGGSSATSNNRIASNNSGSYSGSLQNVQSIRLKFHVYGNHGEDFSTIGAKNKDGDWAKANLTFKIWDTAKPTLSYTGGTNATVNTDKTSELLVKLGTENADDPENRYYDVESEYLGTSGTNATAAKQSLEYVDLSFAFSKPVTVAQLTSRDGSTLGNVGAADQEALVSHTLFTNTLGTGYLGQGDPRGLDLFRATDTGGASYITNAYSYAANGANVQTDAYALLSGKYLKTMSYRYAANYGDYFGNNPIEAGGGIESNAGYSYGDSLLTKIYNAGFHDAAGNPLAMPSGSAGSNIFDKTDGGYDVIVDAVPPTYSRVGNGISPDILTQTVLNENDTVDFIVSFSEATITKRGWDENKTYLMLNNGDKAYYNKAKSEAADDKQWVFTYTFKNTTAEEASLLKVVALTNEALDGSLHADATGSAALKSNLSAYTIDVDARTVTDYVGNIMCDRANEDSTTNTDQIESSISWAGLAVDNTVPNIGFSYNVYGTGTLTKATDADWGQAAKVYVSAEDPGVPVAKYDPDYSSSNQTRPSKGIYRPDNTTGSTASAVGLIFYVWTRNVTAPDTGTNFEAIKRFSLTGIQPKTVTEAGYNANTWTWDGTDVKNYVGNLMMANNYSDIVPPDAAMKSDGSGDGAWYLHVWTADMTWDTARQLMQYEKAQSLQYNSGYDAAKFLALKQAEIEAEAKNLIKSDVPTVDEARNAVIASVYETAYTAGFFSQMNGNYTDSSMSSAVTWAQGRTENDLASLIYNSGYSASSLEDTEGSARYTAVTNYINDNSPSVEDAWSAVRDQFYSDVYADAGFAAWLVSDWDDTTDPEENAAFALSNIRDVDADALKEYYASQYPYKDGGSAAALAEALEKAGTDQDRIKAAYTDNYKPIFIAWLAGIDTSAMDATTLTAQTEGSLDTNIATYLALPEGTVTQESRMVDALAKATAASNTEHSDSTVSYKDSYTADTAKTLKERCISSYQTDNKPSRETAWDAVKETVFQEVYTARYLALQDASGKDRYGTEAVAYALAQLAQYNEGYNASRVTSLLNSKIAEYQRTHSKSGSAKTGDGPDYDAAWRNVRAKVYQAAYTDEFLTWLWQQTHPNGTYSEIDFTADYIYSDDAMVYARTQAMLTLTAYENVTVWPLSDYQNADSNWMLRTSRLLLDNTAPADAVFNYTAITGNNTANVTMSVTVGDALSGIDVGSITEESDNRKLYYQWVRVGANATDATITYTEIDWVQVSPDSSENMPNALTDQLAAPTYGAKSVTFTAVTLGNVVDDGKYVLFVKFTDMAGNTTISHSLIANGVIVDSANPIVCTFGPEEALDGYRKSITPTVMVTGVKVSKVEYAVSNSTETNDLSYAEVSSTTANDTDMEYVYTLPELGSKYDDGTWYAHVMVYEDAGQGTTTHYYRQSYRLDHTPPVIYINPDGFEQPQASVTAAVSFSDALSGVRNGTTTDDDGESVYQYIYYFIDGNSTAEDPGKDRTAWSLLPTDGKVTIEGNEKSYYLHVIAEDNAGNVTVRDSAKAFTLRVTAEVRDLPEYACQLLTTYDVTDEEGNVTASYAVANLTLDDEEKAGYRYSISTDAGQTWCNWLPYMSMIQMKLPDSYAYGDLKVKFRDPDGNAGTEADRQGKNISIDTVTDAIWATAEFDSMTKRQTGKTLTFLMNQPEGVTVIEKVAEGATGRATKLDNGNFTVTDNGVYEFSLSRGEQTAESSFIIVVDIFDVTAPVGYVSYSELAPTNGNVVATVSADEPIYVRKIVVDPTNVTSENITGGTKITGKTQYSFSQNGSCVFVIADEAGNTSNVTATVTNIDKTAPNVVIDESSTPGTPGVTLTVRKTSNSDEEFTVVNNDQSYTMTVTESGTYKFVVQDAVGNVGQVTRAVAVVNTLPGYTVAYHYNDANKTAVGENTWKQGTVTATVTFDEITDGRVLYLGAAYVENSGTPVNKALSKNNDGRYCLEKTYSANGTAYIAVCDKYGNVERVKLTITGLDNTAPTLTLNKTTTAISFTNAASSYNLSTMSKAEIVSLLGGYTISDNISAAENISVTVAIKGGGTTITTSGEYTLVYTATDGAGNKISVEQRVVVLPENGLLVFADGVLLSSASTNTSILPDNTVTFTIDKDRMQAMFYWNGTSNEKVYNQAMRYDIYYVSGLYREGQLKTIATRLTSEQLTSQQFTVTFPKPGWYTIIIRNQERSREYTTFFVSSMSES